MVRFPSSMRVSRRTLGSDNPLNGYRLLRRLLQENLTLVRELEQLRLLRRLAEPKATKAAKAAKAGGGRQPVRTRYARRLVKGLVGSRHSATGQGSLLLIAVNDIKLVNDLHGCAVGGDVMREIIDVMRAALGTPAVFYRTRGEEFMVLLPDAAAADAARMMARLRAAVIRTGARRDLSISVSVVSASWPADGVGVAALCRKAEHAMQLEKRRLRGRGRRRPPRIGSAGSVPALVK